MTETPLALKPDATQTHPLKAVSGTAEVLIVMGASIAAGIAAAGLVSPSLPAALGLGSEAEPDFLAASTALGVQMLAQYAALFALAAIFGLGRGRRRLKSYALGAPDRGTHQHPWLYGLLVGLVAGILPTGVFILQDLAPIGQDTPFWPVLRDAAPTWQFYLFVGIGSFAVIPIVEEIAWRGYILGRLLEGFTPGAALVLSTIGFSVLHMQYLAADPALLLTFVGLLVASVMFGLCVLRTGSIWPAVLSHALINLPPPTELLIAKLALGVVMLVVFARPIARELVVLGKLVWRWHTLMAFAAFAGIAALAALALLVPLGAYVAGAIALALALGLGLYTRSAWR